MTVGELLSRISGRELAEWRAVARIEAEDARADELARKAQAGLNS